MDRELASLTGPNPYQDLLDKAELSISQTRKQIAATKLDIEAASTTLEARRYWVKGFKDLRLWLIEDALAELEIETANALQQLGLFGWTVTFEVERETQAGTVSRGFNVLVRSPSTDKPVRWESWSGGETQRLRIAGALALAQVVKARRAAVPGFEIWDEPTTHLSDTGIADLLTFFRGRALEQRRLVWLIDHRSHKAGSFDGEYRVVRTSNGSRIKKVDYDP
jgi:DNA repair exonuclease SbcCD ATPase subunit